jgi:hypothetical protein
MKESAVRVRMADCWYGEGRGAGGTGDVLQEEVKTGDLRLSVSQATGPGDAESDDIGQGHSKLKSTSDTNRAQDPISSAQQCLYAFLQTKPCNTIITVPIQHLAWLSDLLLRARCHRSLLPQPMSVQFLPRGLLTDLLTSQCLASP